MFHSHALHLQAEAILRGAGAQLGESHTFRDWNPVCAIGRLAREAGFIPLAPSGVEGLAPNSTWHTTAGADVVQRVYGLTESQVRRIMEINDAAGLERLEKLGESLRSFCPVCTRLEAHRERRVVEVLRREA